MTTKYIKKPVIYEAEPWQGQGHLTDMVKPYEPQIINDCRYCGKPMTEHGLISTLYRGMKIICKGDYIVKDNTGVVVDTYKPVRFFSNFEEVKCKP